MANGVDAGTPEVALVGDAEFICILLEITADDVLDGDVELDIADALAELACVLLCTAADEVLDVSVVLGVMDVEVSAVESGVLVSETVSVEPKSEKSSVEVLSSWSDVSDEVVIGAALVIDVEPPPPADSETIAITVDTDIATVADSFGADVTLPPNE